MGPTQLAVKPIVVLGAGLSGLSAAWELARRCPKKKVVVLEASSRTGCWLNTTVKDGFIFDQGPHSIRSGPASYSLCDMVEKIGLADQIILPDKNPESMRRYLYLNGSIHAAPYGALDAISTPGIMGRGLILAALKEIFVAKKDNADDESIHSFTARKFGQEIADVFFGSLAHGIYGGNAKELSVRACFPALYNYEQAAGGLVRGMITGKGAMKKDKPEDFDVSTQSLIEYVGKSIWSFQGGIGALASGLERALRAMPNVDLRLNQPCTSVHMNSDGPMVTTVEGERPIHASHVISSIPSPKLAQILENRVSKYAKQWEKPKEIMANVPFASMAVVNIGFDTKVNPLKGFGYLVPPQENDNILGVIFDSSVFPAMNNSKTQDRLTVMMGGHRMKEVFGSTPPTDKAMADMALDGLRRHLGIRETPDLVQPHLHVDCIPQYQIGHVTKMEELKKHLEELGNGQLAVVGSSYAGVSVNDCVRTARRVAKAIALGNDVDTGL